MNSKKIIIAIDGYSSCGKSTIAKALASRLSYGYVDTGAMYRAVTLFFLQKNIFHTEKGLKHLDHEFLEEIMDHISIFFHFNPALGYGEIYLNGKNVENEIRQMMVSDYVSAVSAIKEVRVMMVDLQQKMGLHRGIVMDGRDIGTTVFPDAELKLFMQADPEIRAIRRFDEMKAKGIVVTLDEVRNNIQSRDYEDTHRKESPLTQASDAIVLDNTHLSQEEQLEMAYSLAMSVIHPEDAKPLNEKPEVSEKKTEEITSETYA
jgi:cytidylate kinase